MMTLSSSKGSCIKQQVSRTAEDCLSLKGLKSEILRTNSSVQCSKPFFVIFSVTNNNVVVADWILERVLEN